MIRTVLHLVVSQSKTPVKSRVRRPLLLRLIDIALSAACSLAMSGTAAASCVPGDFACEAFAPSAPPAVSKHRPAPQPQKTQLLAADYIEAFNEGRLPGFGAASDNAFIRAVFTNFEQLPNEWKDTACRKLYPQALREGAIDIPTHKAFFAKCEAFNRESAH